MNTIAEPKQNKKLPPNKPKFLIGVRINTQFKSTLYDPKDLKLRVGMSVMINTSEGLKWDLWRLIKL